IYRTSDQTLRLAAVVHGEPLRVCRHIGERAATRGCETELTNKRCLNSDESLGYYVEMCVASLSGKMPTGYCHWNLISIRVFAGHQAAIQLAGSHTSPGVPPKRTRSFPERCSQTNIEIPRVRNSGEITAVNLLSIEHS